MPAELNNRSIWRCDQRQLKHGVWEERAFYATLWSGTRPQGLLGKTKKKYVKEMWCIGARRSDLSSRTPRVCSFLLSLRFRVRFPVCVDMARCNTSQCAGYSTGRVNPPPHATGRSLSEHIAAHSHLNKSIHHVSVFGSLFIFNYWAHTDTLVPAVLQENTFI